LQDLTPSFGDLLKITMIQHSKNELISARSIS